MRKIVRTFLCFLICAVYCAALASFNPVGAQCPTLPYTLTNGQTADATQVMADLTALLNCVNNEAGGAANSVQYNAAGALGGVGPLTNGQLVIGSTGGAPQAATLTAGPGVAITNGSGSVTLSAPGSASAPTLVQSAYTRITSGSSGTVTLSSTPTVGNLLVAVATGYGGGSATLAVPSGFYTAFANINNIAANQGIVIGARVVQTGDGTAWSGFSGGNGGDTFGIFEFSGAHAIQATAAQGVVSGSTWKFFAGSPINAYTFFVLENDNTNGYSSISGASLLFNGTNTASNHPAVIATISAGSAANATVTYTGSTFGNSIFVAASVLP